MSGGAQKNFVAFANEVAAKWEMSDIDFNEAYFRQLVAKAILFNTVRSEVARQDWYQAGYLANIVTYTIAKMAEVVADKGQKAEFNFDAVWQQQAVSQPTLDFAMAIAVRAMAVLTANERPVANVTEWAKRPECWETVRVMPVPMSHEFEDELVSGVEARTNKRAARIQQKTDDGIESQTAVLAVNPKEWAAMLEFAAARRLMSPTDAGILALVTGTRPRIPTEKQSARLLDFKQRVVDHGYEYDL